MARSSTRCVAAFWMICAVVLLASTSSTAALRTRAIPEVRFVEATPSNSSTATPTTQTTQSESSTNSTSNSTIAKPASPVSSVVLDRVKDSKVCSSRPNCPDPHQECIYSRKKFSQARRKASVIETLKAFMQSKYYDKKEFFAYGGTLIGAKRDGKFIPWDEDGDLAVSWSHFKKLLNMTKGKDTRFGKNNRFVLNVQCRHLDIPGRVIDSTTGFFVDIFTFFESSNWKECTESLYKQQWPQSDKWTSDILFNPYPFPEHLMTCKRFTRSQIYPLQPCKFEQLTLSCPNKAEEVLRNCYGAEWKTPQKHFMLM